MYTCTCIYHNEILADSIMISTPSTDLFVKLLACLLLTPAPSVALMPVQIPAPDMT